MGPPISKTQACCRKRRSRGAKVGSLRSHPLLVGLVSAALFAVVASGCSQQGLERVTLNGTVSYRGEPVEEGEIRLIPSKETKGPMSGARIMQGKYVVDAKGGVPVGKYRVKITANRVHPDYRDLAESPPPKAYEGEWPPKQQYLPEKYNTKTRLEINVPSGSGKMTRDFVLND